MPWTIDCDQSEGSRNHPNRTQCTPPPLLQLRYAKAKPTAAAAGGNSAPPPPPPPPWPPPSSSYDPANHPEPHEPNPRVPNPKKEEAAPSSQRRGRLQQWASSHGALSPAPNKARCRSHGGRHHPIIHLALFQFVGGPSQLLPIHSESARPSQPPHAPPRRPH